MSWRTIRLANIAVAHRQIIGPDSPAKSERPYLGLEQIEAGTGRILNYDGNPAEGKSTTFAFDERHILYGKLRPYLNKVATPDRDGRCSTEIIPLLPTGVDRSFLAFLLRTDRVINGAMAEKTGSRMPRADVDALLRLEVTIPDSLDEQRRVAARLKAQLAEVDAARQAARAQLRDAALLQRRLLQAAFHQLVCEPLTLGCVLNEIQTGKSFLTAEVLARPDELGVLKVSAVSWSQFRADQAKALKGEYTPAENHRVKQGDLLISRANTRELVGAVVLVERDYPMRLLSDKTLRLVVDESRANKDYLLLALRTELAREHIELYATGTSDSMRNISQDVIASIPILLPPLDDQCHIVARLKSQLDETDNMAQSVTAQLAEIERLPQHLLSQTFNNVGARS
ncbi:MAG: hypothetical protein GDA68_11130 [Nitrospira sp. CR2.1]|nr:hypothetical protein [Nitrospira sp. CR2.1]MBA5874141.1 hypothetical protein [Nitrospira sp. CR1.2]